MVLALISSETFRKSGRSLTLRQPINLIIIENVREVQVSSSRVHEVARAYPQSIAISPNRDHRQSRVRQSCSCCDWQDSAVQSVEAVSIDEVRRFSRASDSREHSDPVWFQLHL